MQTLKNLISNRIRRSRHDAIEFAQKLAGHHDHAPFPDTRHIDKPLAQNGASGRTIRAKDERFGIGAGTTANASFGTNTCKLTRLVGDKINAS